MKYKRNSYPPINIGTSFMVVIFIILSMVIFAVLSLSSALKDSDYSEKKAARTLAYYEANNQAEERLADIDTILGRTTSQNALIQKLQALEDVTVTPFTGSTELKIVYTIPIDDNEVLQVILSTQANDGHNYTIQSWTQLTVTEWTSNPNLPVLGSH